MGRDFTFTKLKEVYKAILNSKYTTLTVKDYLSLKDKPERLIVIRHDVDTEPELSLKLARIEKEFGISSTYYFRAVDEVFQTKIMKEIVELGHELGYHYEVLEKAEGNYRKAIKFFKDDLVEFRKIYNVKTISPHGSPIVGAFSPYSFLGILDIIKAVIQRKDVFTLSIGQDLWNEFDFKEFGIIGDAYLSIDFNNVLYLSDTGRNWNKTRFKLKDVVEVTNTSYQQVNVNCTDDIINLIKQENINHIYILIHANHWRDNFKDWLEWISLQQIRRMGKLWLKWRMGT